MEATTASGTAITSSSTTTTRTNGTGEYFANRVAKMIHEKYQTLPNKGKPLEKQWSILAGIVATTESNPEDARVICLATGNKCVGSSSMSPLGDVLNDNHAEILTRRSFKRFVLHQLNMLLADKQSLYFARHSDRFTVRDGVQFHFYVSQTPCGDASIFPQLRTDGNLTPAEPDSSTRSDTTNRKRNQELDECVPVMPDAKRQRSEGEKEDAQQSTSFTVDSQRTGAKVVAGEAPDPLSSGIGYHASGVLRTKPGRGERTLSMSCSDKIARWNYLGLQGALLMRLFDKPLYLSTIIVGELFHAEALERALYGRISHIPPWDVFSVRRLTILPTTERFERGRQSVSTKCHNPVPCGSAINWSAPDVFEATLSASGRKFGFVTKDFANPKARSSLCKAEFFKALKALQTKLLAGAKEEDREETYRAAKTQSIGYSEAWSQMKRSVFANWITNDPALENFPPK